MHFLVNPLLCLSRTTEKTGPTEFSDTQTYINSFTFVPNGSISIYHAPNSGINTIGGIEQQKLGLSNDEEHVLKWNIQVDNIDYIENIVVSNEIKDLVFKRSIAKLFIVGLGLIKLQTWFYNLPSKLIGNPLFNKLCVALYQTIRTKQAQVYLRKYGQRDLVYVCSREELVELWKLCEKLQTSAFPLSEQSGDTTSSLVSGLTSLLFYTKEVWSTDRGGHSYATATLPKLRFLLKRAVPKSKTMYPSYVTYAQSQTLSSGRKPHSHLAISEKAKAELKAPSSLFTNHYTYSPLSKTSLQPFYQPTPPLQEAPSSELLGVVQEFLPSGATSSVLDSKELPSGRQVPTDPQGRKQTGQGSHQGEQSKGARSGSVQSGGTSSGVGGQGGASGSDGGDGDPPWKHTYTKSHYDDEPKPKKKKKKKKAVEDEKEVLNSADSVTSDDEPKPKPKQQLQSTDRSYNEWKSDDAGFEQTRRNDSGTHLDLPLSTPHSAFAKEEQKTQPHLPDLFPLGYIEKKSHCHDSHKDQNLEASLVSLQHEETQNLPMPFPINASPPRLSPQTWTPPSPLEDMLPSPPSSPSSHDSAVSFQSVPNSTSYSSLSDTSTGIEETEQPAGDSELAIFPPLSSLVAAEPSTIASSSPPHTTMEQPNLPIPFRSQVSPYATSESATDDDSDASNDEKGDRANG